MYINKVMLVGNITKDLELKSLPSGSSVCSFGLATNRSWKDKDGAKKDEVEYHNIVVFGKQAETLVSYMRKGFQIYVEGRLQTRSWEDKETGKKQYRTEIVAESIQFGTNKRPEGQNGTTGSINGVIDDNNFATVPEKPRAKAQTERARLDNEPMPDYGDSINPEDIPF